MILNKNRNPKYSLYYIGAEILNILKTSKITNIFSLYEILNKNVFFNSLSIDYLYYSLDWLYLLKKIKLEKENIVLCN